MASRNEVVSMTPPSPDDIYDAATRRYGIDQAKALREQARTGGLRFDVYLPGGLAEWLLDQIERGLFVDPSEAVFVMLTDQQDLEPHADLREEILRRSCQAAQDDPQRIPHEEVVERMRASAAAPRPAPAIWLRRP
jgi:antitoxin ParD1/3/4